MDGRTEPDNAQYTDLFISEAQEHLEEMNRLLLAIEAGRQEGAPDTEPEQIAGLFRAAHTLKGMSAALGFQQIAGLAHRMEDLLDLWRQRKRSLTPALANVLFACLDRLDNLVNAIATAGRETGDSAQELARLDEVLQASAKTSEAQPPPEFGPSPVTIQPAWEAQIQIAADCQLKGPRAFVVLRRVSSLAPLLGCQPPEPELLAGNYAESFCLFFGAKANPQALSQAVERVAEVISANLKPVESPQLTETNLQPEPVAQPKVDSPSPATAPTQPPHKTSLPPGELEAASTFVRLKVSLLDQLLEAAADLVVNHSLLMQVARKHDLPDLKDGLEAHATAVKRLEQVVLSMRMVPVAQVFNRFPRLVRDLAQNLGKEVRFEMEGGEIELDRMILDRLTDPLVHLLRNAVDHGVELPEERRQAGKALPAQIRLSARREQNKVLIEVSEDGRGLSPEKILRVALERGILTQRQAANLDQAAILDLICLPGFSTKTQISGVSGRGVGMDVVKQTLNEMGGDLSIESHPGQGSLFRLTCPLTMAILPAILVRCGAERYAIPLTHVVHTLEPQATELRWLYSQPVLPWEQTLLPLFSLGQFLGTPNAAPIPHFPEQLPPETTAETNGETGKPLQVVMVARGRQTYGLVVDEILGKEDIVLKPLAKYLGAISGLSGVTLRGEGEIALVLDVAGLVQTLAASGKGNGDE